MNAPESLKEVEALKQLKARYCRLLDEKSWTVWRQLFTDDFVSDTTETGGKRIESADEFVAFVRKILGSPRRPTVHQIYAPEIDLMSATTARGIWAFEDVVKFFPGLSIRGYGHYHETYEKVAGEWRIKSSKLTRLRMDLFTPIFSLDVAPWIKKRNRADPAR